MGGSILRRQDWFFPLNQNRWQAAVKVDKLYGDPIGAQAPAIAVVDSGVDATVPDFGGRVVTQVNLDSRNEGESGDNFGHGTMVAGVAAGAAMTLPGAAPKAKIVSVRTSNANNESLVSDVIAAAQWIKANKDAYGIRVANFSLLAAAPSSFVWDPLDQALEQLWFSGVVVVAASGNLGPVPMDYAPANDPFVIVVGATDTGNDAGLATTRSRPSRPTAARTTASRVRTWWRPAATWSRPSRRMRRSRASTRRTSSQAPT